MEKINWDAEKAIRMLNTKGTNRYDRDREPKKVRIEVYKNNLEVYRQWGYVTDSGKEVELTDKQKTLDATKVYSKPFSVENNPVRFDKTDLVVEPLGCLEAGLKMMERGLNPAILNFADAYEACGMYNEGSNAQEESLCRESTLPPTLYQYYKKLWARKSSVPMRETPGYPMDKNYGGIYSKVTVFREGPLGGFRFLETPYDTAVISVACLRFTRKSLDENGVDTNHSDIEYRDEHTGSWTPEGKEIMCNKVRTIYRIAIENGHDSVVLGAWGCGVFKQRREHIARLFVSVVNEPEFKGKLKELFFAVPGGENYYSFARTIFGPSFGKPFGGPNFYSFQLGDDPIWGCEYPGSPKEDETKLKVQDALEFGITHFIDLTEEGELSPYSHLLPDDGTVSYERFPVKDQRVPSSIGDVLDLMERIQEITRNPDNKIYLHCWGGVGRTGTIAACWLTYSRKLDAETALSLLRKYWCSCKKSAWRVIPETANQEKFIAKFADYLRNRAE